LQCLVLRPLLRKFALGFGALILDLVLASILLRREPEPNASERKRDYE
jgi:hypothetical protein